MRLLMIPAILVLAGCATGGRVLSPQEAQQMSAAELCLGVSTYGPQSAANAQAELYRRGINCADHAQGVQDLQQRRAAAMQYLLGQPPAPKRSIYPMPPQPTNCQTYRVGDTLNTRCN